MTRKTTKAVPFEHYGIKVNPTNLSRYGTKRPYTSLQGWLLDGPKGEVWSRSAKKAKELIEMYRSIAIGDSSGASEETIQWCMKTFASEVEA